MSYILEALKISEQSRQKAAAAARPSLLPPMADLEPEPRRPWAAYLAVAALVINGVVIVTMLRAPATDVGDSPLPKAIAAPAAPLPAVAAVAQAAAAPISAPPIAEDPVPSPPPPTRPPRTETAHHPPAAAVEAAASPPALATVVAAATPQAVAKAPETRVEAPPAADGVPASIQQLLPPLNVAGVIQDNDHNDLVIVNDKLLREGDEAAPGLKVEKILADGALFSFKGYRFKR